MRIDMLNLFMSRMKQVLNAIVTVCFVLSLVECMTVPLFVPPSSHSSYTLPWLYFTRPYSATLYHGSTMALPWLYHGSTRLSVVIVEWTTPTEGGKEWQADHQQTDSSRAVPPFSITCLDESEVSHTFERNVVFFFNNNCTKYESYFNLKTVVYYAGIFSTFSHHTNQTLVYYAGIFSTFSHHTNWTLVYYAGIFSTFSHHTNQMVLYYAGIFSVFSHHTNQTLVYYILTLHQLDIDVLSWKATMFSISSSSISTSAKQVCFVTIFRYWCTFEVYVSSTLNGNLATWHFESSDVIEIGKRIIWFDVASVIYLAGGDGNMQVSCLAWSVHSAHFIF